MGGVAATAPCRVAVAGIVRGSPISDEEPHVDGMGEGSDAEHASCAMSDCLRILVQTASEPLYGPLRAAALPG